MRQKTDQHQEDAERTIKDTRRQTCRRSIGGKRDHVYQQIDLTRKRSSATY